MAITISGRPYGIGAAIALIVLVVDIVLLVTSKGNFYELLLIGGLALAILL